MLLYFKRYQSPAEFSQKVSTAEALVDKFVLNVRSKGISAVSAGEKTGAYVTGLTAAMLTAFKKMEQKLNDDAFLKDAVHLAERPKEPLRRLGRISRFVVFEHPDLLRVLSDSSAKVARQMGVVTVPFDLVIVDPKVLDHLLDDFDNLAMVLQGAADFSAVKKDFEIAVNAAANTKGITPSKFQEKCTAALDVCREGAIKRVNARLKRELGVQATRTAYNKQMAIKVASNAAGVALGLGSMAAGGFSGGVGLVLGIISIAKSALTLFDAIVTLRMGTEKVAKALKSGVIKLSKRYQSQYKALATEAGLQTLMGLASLPQGAIGMLSSTFATVKSLKDMAGVLVGKVAGLELKSREAAIKASEALESGQGLLREFGKWYKANGARIGAEHQKALAKEVRKLRAVLDSTAKLFVEAAELGDRVTKVSAESVRIQTDLDALDGMAGVKTAQTAAAVLTGLGNLALSGACASQFSLDGVGSAAAAGKKVAELLCTEVGVMNDAFFNGKDIVDALRG